MLSSPISRPNFALTWQAWEQCCSAVPPGTAWPWPGWPVPTIRGIVSGLTGGSLFVITSFFSYGSVNVFAIKTQTALAVAYLVFVLLGVISFMLFQRYRYRGTAKLAAHEQTAGKTTTAAQAAAEAMYTH